MNRRRYIAAFAAGTASALAGCTSGGGGSEDTTTATTTTTESMQTTTAMGDATVAVRSTEGYGDVLVDSEGMSLYLFTQDSGGESSCYGDCASNWPPLTVEEEPTAGDGVSASLGTTERDDGSMQVTADGNPLYYFRNDSEPGDTTGQGLNDAWYLLAPDGSRIDGTATTTTESMASPSVDVRSTEEYGDVLVDSDGMSLYLFTQDDGSTSNCYGDCASNWPPLTVEGEPTASDAVTAELGTTERDDASMQVTAAGHPLYYFAGDSSPGDTSGQGLNDAWYLLAPDGSQVGGTSTTTTTDGGGGGGAGGGY